MEQFEGSPPTTRNKLISPHLVNVEASTSGGLSPALGGTTVLIRLGREAGCAVCLLKVLTAIETQEWVCVSACMGGITTNQQYVKWNDFLHSYFNSIVNIAALEALEHRWYVNLAAVYIWKWTRNQICGCIFAIRMRARACVACMNMFVCLWLRANIFFMCPRSVK